MRLLIRQKGMMVMFGGKFDSSVFFLSFGNYFQSTLAVGPSFYALSPSICSTSRLFLRCFTALRPNQAQQLAALEAVKNLAGNAQLMTDLFLNYDCNLQASNLYERTLKCLAKVLQSNSSSGQYYSSTSGKIRGLALDTLLLLLQALDERASPLKVSHLLLLKIPVHVWLSFNH